MEEDGQSIQHALEWSSVLQDFCKHCLQTASSKITSGACLKFRFLCPISTYWIRIIGTRTHRNTHFHRLARWFLMPFKNLRTPVFEIIWPIIFAFVLKVWKWGFKEVSDLPKATQLSETRMRQSYSLCALVLPCHARFISDGWVLHGRHYVLTFKVMRQKTWNYRLIDTDALEFQQADVYPL